jgi:hypothetical protein
MDTDLRNTKARLIKLAIAVVIGAVLTWFTMRAMMSSGPSAPSAKRDPVGASEVPLLAIFIFVVTTAFSHVILSKRRR